MSNLILTSFLEKEQRHLSYLLSSFDRIGLFFLPSCSKASHFVSANNVKRTFLRIVSAFLLIPQDTNLLYGSVFSLRVGTALCIDRNQFLFWTSSQGKQF